MEANFAPGAPSNCATNASNSARSAVGNEPRSGGEAVEDPPIVVPTAEVNHRASNLSELAKIALSWLGLRPGTPSTGAASINTELGTLIANLLTSVARGEVWATLDCATTPVGTKTRAVDAAQTGIRARRRAFKARTLLDLVIPDPPSVHDRTNGGVERWRVQRLREKVRPAPPLVRASAFRRTLLSNIADPSAGSIFAGR